MSIFNRMGLNPLSSSSVLRKWDSREQCKLKKLNESPVKEIQSFIEKYDSYTTYYKCFLNSVFMSEIASCFEHEKEFINCEFEFKNIYHYASYIKYFEFKNCTFYIAQYKNECPSFVFYPELKEALFSNGNTVIKKSYIEYLSEKHNGDLNKVESHLLNGISIAYSDLSNTIIPNNEDFFVNLSENDIIHTKLNTIDFNKYNIHLTRFSNVTFKDGSIMSHNILTNGLFHCTLPKIDFNIYGDRLYHCFSFIKCVFAEGTIFPSYKNFFLDVTISGCSLPTYDYSLYNVAERTFMNCSFNDNSILPSSLFNFENINNLNNITRLPKSSLNKFIMFGRINEPCRFFKCYFENLTNEDIYILSNKYKIA